MSNKEENFDFVRNYTDSYIDLSRNRSIFLAEDITQQSATELSTLLLYYNNIDPNETINLYIHSNGGDIGGLISIYDVMQMIKAPISTILLGKCYSAAAVILAAGTKGERYALKNSHIMIHGPQFAFPIAGGDLVSSKNYLEFVNDTNDMVMKILSKHTKQSLNKLKKDCEREHWMNAQQAKNYGLIDKII